MVVTLVARLCGHHRESGVVGPRRLSAKRLLELEVQEIVTGHLRPRFDAAQGGEQWDDGRRAELVQELNKLLEATRDPPVYTRQKLRDWIGGQNREKRALWARKRREKEARTSLPP